MLIRVARREIVSMLRDGRFRLASLIVMLFLGVALYSGWVSSREEAAMRQQTMRSFRDEWLNQQDKNPHTGGHFGTYVMKPARSLAGIEPGLDPYIGRLIFLEAHVRNDFTHRPATDETSLRQFGYFTASFILLVVAPLLIVLFGYTAFAGERETGTLRQALASGAPPATVLLGKLLGVLGGLLLLLLPAALVGTAAIGLSQGVFEPARVALMAGGYLLYFLAYAGLTLGLSACVPRSQIALVGLLGFWAVSSFVVPRVASDWASGTHPLPSRAAFMDDVRRKSLEGIDGHDPLDKRRDELLEKVLAEYGVETVEELPVNFNAIAMQASEDYTTQVYAESYKRLADAMLGQAATLSRASALSPLIAMRDWSMASAGTDLHHHLDFSEAVEQYRQKINRMLNKDMEVNSTTDDYGYYVTQEFWETIPSFEYDAPSAAWSLSNVRGSLVSLGLWAAVSLGLACVSAMRIRP